MSTSPTTKQKVKHPYVTRDKGVCGGKPIIAGTRIKVSQIATEHDRLGWTPDEIVQAHPHLTLAQVHDALSYYYDHLEEIDRQIAEERQAAEEMKEGAGSVLEERKRGGDSNLP